MTLPPQTDVQPVALESLPKLSSQVLRRSQALSRALAGLSALRSITARGLGRVSLTVERADPWPWRADAGKVPSESTFVLVRDDGTLGSVSVERFFSLALVRAALGAPSPPVLRPLSPSERGVLGAMVASVLQAAGTGRIRTTLDPPRALVGDLVAFHLEVRTAALTGVALVEVPVEWLPTQAFSLPAEAGWLLETELRLELGRTSLPGEVWASAEVGDAVVFEGVSALDDEAAWPCDIHIGPHSAPARLDGRGELGVAGAFLPTPDRGGPLLSDEDLTSPRLVPEDAAQLLASAPVEIVAEIGRLPMRGDEVMGLVNGTVIALGERRRDMVTLRVGGRPWARGELVNVDDQLGVRITEILRPR
jgi:flagellar motor switch/type III secretory pathway protein FliN